MDWRATRHYLALFTGLISLLGTAQELQTYAGDMHVGKYFGQADYSYRSIDGDTILDGPFKLQRSNLDALLNKEDVTFFFSGAFESGKPNGDWQFHFGEFQSDRETEVVGFQYKINVSGQQEHAEGRIISGKPDGIWSYSVNEIEDSEVTRTKFKSTIEYDNGVPQKSFQIQKGDTLLVGRFLRNGLAHDEWTLFSNTDIDASERWNFDNGRLVSIDIQNNEASKQVTVYGGGINNDETINLDGRYLKIIGIQSDYQLDHTTSSRGIYQLLAENARYYQKIDAILSELGESEFLPQFKVRVGHYPLDSLENRQLESIRRLTKNAVQISETLLNDTQLNLLKLSEPQAAFLHETVKVLHNDFIKPLKKLDGFAQEDIVRHVSRQRLINHLWPNGLPATTLNISTADSLTSEKTFRGPDAFRYDFSENTMASVHQMAEYTSKSLDSIQGILNVRLAQEKREQRLIGFEKQLIAKTDSLNSMVDSLASDLPKDHSSALKNVARVAKNRLAVYSAMEESAAKLDTAQVLVVCFDRFIDLADAVAKQPERDAKIQEKYTDKIWNFFMATLMDEEVKKRIVTAYRKRLVPSIMETITNELTCQNVAHQRTVLDAAYKRMLALRNEDTAKLERKLKREENPEEIIRLFNLQSISQ